MTEDIQELRKKLGEADPLKAELEAHSWSELIEEKEIKANTDELTGLLNRRAGKERLEREMVRSKRLDIPLSLIFIDLDDFKRVNDKLGHAKGDEVLKETTRIISANIRPKFDAACRWTQGDELVLILPDSYQIDASIKAEIIKEKIKKELQDFKITASCGVIQWQPGQSIDEFMDAADKTMYAAKESGPNQTFVFRDGAPISVKEVIKEAQSTNG